MATLAALVKTLRQSRGLSQAQLGTEAHIGQTYLSDIEKGKTKLPSVDHRRRLAAALGTSNIELLLAAGEVNEGDLITWARQGGFVRQVPSEDEEELTQLARELALEGAQSARLGLAMLIPSMTLREAIYITKMFDQLPNEGQAKRRELKCRELTREDYRRWRDIQDIQERTRLVKEEL